MIDLKRTTNLDLSRYTEPEFISSASITNTGKTNIQLKEKKKAGFQHVALLALAITGLIIYASNKLEEKF